MAAKNSGNKLLVRKIKDGIVIDHIPSGKGLLVLEILNLDPSARTVIASNMDSTKLGKKDIIKVEGKYLTSKELDIISLVAPEATINIIDNWDVKEKREVEIPSVIEGIFKCPNPSCTTNSKYSENPTFRIVKPNGIHQTRIECKKCGASLYYGTILDHLKSGKAVIRGLTSKEKIEKEFLDLLVNKGAFKVAKNVDDVYVLKSGRPSPYFVNLRALTDGESLARLKWVFSSFIAQLLEQGKIEDFDFVFGPAYAGINLATLISEGLNEFYGMKKRYLYDRKEIKDYGDVSADKLIVGAGHFNSGQKILIVDDVVTTGKTKVESAKKLKMLGDHEIVGLVLAVDRQEKMGGSEHVEDRGAVNYLEEDLGINVFSILNIDTTFEMLKENIPEKIKEHWIKYYDKYGVVKLE